MAALRPLVQWSRPSKNGLAIEKKISFSLFLTHSGDKQSALKRLVDEFKANARELGVDIKMTDSQDL
jgi:predicted amino acid-binding ACT domain protein